MSFVKTSTAIAALLLLIAASPMKQPMQQQTMQPQGSMQTQQSMGLETSDPQIATIVLTAGTIDIQTAQNALQKSKNKEVRNFANELIRDHKTINGKIVAFLRSSKSKQTASDSTQSMLTDAKEERARLATLKGDEFDREFIGNELAFHKNVTGEISTRLIPSATSDKLKEILTATLTTCQGHEQKADQLDQALRAAHARL